MRRIAVDFEYRDHKEAEMSLVAVSAQIEGEKEQVWWLHNDPFVQMDFKLWCLAQNEIPGTVFIAYGAVAECECFLTLDMEPRSFVWYDLHTDFLQVQNGSPTWNHGEFWSKSQAKVKTCCADEGCDCIDKGYKRVGKARWQTKFSMPVEVEVVSANETELPAGVNIEWRTHRKSGTRYPFGIVVRDWDTDFQQVKKWEEEAYQKVKAIFGARGLSAEPIKANLLNATLLLANVMRHPDDKDEARDVILGNKTYTEEQKQLILDYAQGDTADLFTICDKIQSIMKAQTGWDAETIHAARAWRGRSAANHAHLVRRGLRLSAERLHNLRANKQAVFGQAYMRWNRLVQPMFTWKPKERRWGSATRAKNAFLKRICDENGIQDWERTKKGDYSTSNKAGDALDRYADIAVSWMGGECEYDADGALKGFQRFGKMASSLNSIPPLESASGEDDEASDDGYNDDVTMLSFLGSDMCLRPYFGNYGTQTARNAPKATGFLPAKAAWLRALIEPPPGYAYVELDYSSQETFIAGAISGDQGILRAYDKDGPTKGDPYLAFALDANLITKAEYEDYKNDGEAAKKVKGIRKLCKVIVLGSQFGMGYKKLAIALRSATRDSSITDEYAKHLLELHAKVYATYYEWKAQVATSYFVHKQPIVLPCGWYLASGRRERDKLSVLNVPIQGRGSSIMRLALDKLLDEAVELVAPVHDADIYLVRIEDLDQVNEIAKRCMIEASDEVLGLPGMRVGDPEIVKHGEIWVTEKGERDYHNYKWAFEPPTERAIEVPMGEILDEKF